MSDSEPDSEPKVTSEGPADRGAARKQESTGNARLDAAIARRPLLRLFLRYKTKIGLLALLCGALLIGREVFQASPREVTVIFEFETSFDEVSVVYAQGGEAVRGIEVRDVTDRVRQDVSLSPGDYEVEVRARRDGETRSWERTLTVPTEGRMRFFLE